MTNDDATNQAKRDALQALMDATDYEAEEYYDRDRDADLDSLTVPDGHNLVLTCGACPEQYELLDANGKMVAYFRLRWGHLRVDGLKVWGDTVYEFSFDDGLLGVFPSSESRREHLQKGIDAAMRYKEALDAF